MESRAKKHGPGPKPPDPWHIKAKKGVQPCHPPHEGKWDTSSITTEYRDEQWILTQTGNWERNKVDLNGNGNFTDAGELDDTRTHSPVNEILSRDLDSNPGTTGNNYDLSNSYNLRGDLEDDKQQYKYVWDAFGRLVEVRRQNSSLVAAYRYNGLNQRITWHYDATDNGTTDGSDPTYHFAYDEKWRIVGTWRDTDANLKEMFIYHNAGLAGRGGSSYIDTVVLRDRDMTNGWTGAADGTQEERHYYLQNWRGDVSGIFDHVGALLEWQKYSAYGVPYLITPGDHNKDGVVDSNDYKSFGDDYNAGNLRADLNKDGVLTTADQTLFNDSYTNPVPGGRWKLSSEDIGNRKGYAGYEHEGFGNDLAAPEIAHVRNRVLHFGLGRWTRRDPLGYVDGGSLYAYARSSPTRGVDPMGLADVAVPGGGGCGSSKCGGKHTPPTRTIWPFPGDPMLVPDPTVVICHGSTSSTTTCTDWEDVVTLTPITIDLPRNGCSGSCRYKQRETYTPTRTCTTVTVCDADPSLSWSTSHVETGTPRHVDGPWGYGTWTGCFRVGVPPWGCQCCGGSGASLSCTKCIKVIVDRPGRRL